MSESELFGLLVGTNLIWVCVFLYMLTRVKNLKHDLVLSGKHYKRLFNLARDF